MSMDVADPTSPWQPWWAQKRKHFKETAEELPYFIVTRWQIKLMFQLAGREGLGKSPLDWDGRGNIRLFGIPVYTNEPTIPDTQAIERLVLTLARTRPVGAC